MKSLLFKIEHGDWNAELQLPATGTLESLAYAIIEAVGFDMDHCFGFYDNLKNTHRSKEEYTLFADIGEEAKDGDSGVKTTLVDAVFRPKKKMLFLFDYGDDWMFLVTCTGEAEGRAFKRPKLLATSGTPPVQYPDWDEEEEADDD
ncbi:plasmid pRiA4b ORF-3 family protein [Luteolibacter arcticus]|uniref:Plasmid pRiA4b ORF-3 family protein n=1 Tax=Luteolibacter arcticus TaxID=1581411 RepID=A0ABT3GHS9_9BACT|nr:plasmid pRiA4b ORF-3 family protein [Luteolibacter arcticus]MCW1923054.1 plasmid pRiA4b ORF-3 family protein [Luteolibacter arcticus]